MADTQKFATRANLVSLLSGFKSWVESHVTAAITTLLSTKNEGKLAGDKIPVGAGLKYDAESDTVQFDGQNLNPEDLNLAPATKEKKGLIRLGEGLSVGEDGETVSVDLPAFTDDEIDAILVEVGLKDAPAA